MAKIMRKELKPRILQIKLHDLFENVSSVSSVIAESGFNKNVSERRINIKPITMMPFVPYV